MLCFYFWFSYKKKKQKKYSFEKEETNLDNISIKFNLSYLAILYILSSSSHIPYLNIIRYTLHTTQYPLHTAHCRIHTASCTLQTLLFTLLTSWPLCAVLVQRGCLTCDRCSKKGTVREQPRKHKMYQVLNLSIKSNINKYTQHWKLNTAVIWST